MDSLRVPLGSDAGPIEKLLLAVAKLGNKMPLSVATISELIDLIKSLLDVRVYLDEKVSLHQLST